LYILNLRNLSDYKEVKNGGEEMKNEDLQQITEKIKKISSAEEARTFLIPRGRSCLIDSFRPLLDKAYEARKEAKNEEEIIEKLKKNIDYNIDYLEEIEGKLYMIFPQCYCDRIKGFEKDIPPNYCYCTEGWVKELMEAALKKEIKVELEKSILWGDEKCKIRIEVTKCLTGSLPK